MGQKQSVVQPTFFCPTTGAEITDPLSLCTHCQACHDLIWQSVFVCPNTGYRVENLAAVRRGRECPSCFQPHEPYSKRAFLCPVTGASIPHPRETEGRCLKCGRTHEDNSTPVGSREVVGGGRGPVGRG
jgi:hypothetical protein